MEYETLEVNPISGAMGAEIAGIDLAQPLDNQAFDEIHRAFLEFQVIVFHDQKLDPVQCKAFARRFGRLEFYPFVKGLDEHPEIFEIRKEPDEKKNFGGSWHSDMSFTEAPPVGTMLYAIEMPPKGGDTMLTNLYEAYDALSDGMKDLLDKMTAEYSAALKHSGGRAAVMNRTPFAINLDRAEEASIHPIVRTHPDTGRKALYISAGHLTRFADMTEEESKPLLDYLRDHAVQPDFTCRVRYRAGTLALWDNRCTQHRALNDYHGERRVIHRITIGGGDRPN
ncbi:MAG: taurine dioxygenase [Rhodospirillaceae bacterium]|nr:taurine dioxygenase [Rhodospirillaceae bacterium]|tara:strand:+ start:252 stop:1097 length:846 start_codon:yes stop_codon:yes gene_type:complete